MMLNFKKLLSVCLAAILMLSCFNIVMGINALAETGASSAITESATAAIKALSLEAAGVSSVGELTIDAKYSISRGDSPWYIATRNQNIASGWADAYYFCPIDSDYFKYTASWEYDNASSVNIVNAGTDNEILRVFPHIDSNADMNTRRNQALKVYYIAEANGDYRLSDENVGDIIVSSGKAEGWRAYVSIYVNGFEKFKSPALTEVGQKAGFSGLNLELSVGDKVEYIFDYEFDLEYSGQLYFDFDPVITLVKEREAAEKPAGLGSIADSYGEIASDWPLPPGNNRTTSVTQSQPWKAQYAYYGSDDWSIMPCQYRTTNIGIDNAYAYYVFAKNDWSYSRESYVGGTTWKGTANTQRAVVMYTSYYSTLTPARKVRAAYTADRKGNYSLGFDKNALRIRTVSGLNCNVYFAVTVNGKKVYNIPLTSFDGTAVTATAGTYIELPDYISLKLNAGDTVGIEMYCEAIESLASADAITTKFQIELIPILNCETDYETVITASPAQQLASQAMALNPANKTNTAITQQGPWYAALSQEATGGFFRNAYQIYYTSNYVRYVANWEGDKCGCMYVINCVSGDPFLRTYSRTDQAKENANSGYNSKHKLYYVAEASGTFYFTDSMGGFSVSASGVGHTAYVTVYVNGIEVYKSTPLANEGDFSVFNGFYAKLAKGDIVEYVFDYVYTDTYSGNISIDFDPQVALLHEESYENPVDGIGYIEDSVYDEINPLATSTGLSAGGISQSGPWYAQQDLGAATDWENMNAYFKSASALGANWQIWGYGYKPEDAVTNYEISDAAQIVGYGNWVSTEKLDNYGLFLSLNFDVAKTEGVRMAYTAQKAGKYTLRFNGGIPAITKINKVDFNNLANAKAYLAVTVNGEDVLVSDYLKPVAYNNGPEFQTIQEYTTVDLDENDVLAIELRYDIDDGKALADVTGKASVYLDPYLYYATDFETDYDPNDGIVASIGTELFASLEEAIAAAQDGDIVVLKQDVTLSSPIIIENDITLNLGDYTITSKVSGDSLIKTKADVIINGGKILSDGNASGVISAQAAASIIFRNTVIDFDIAGGAIFRADAAGVSLELNNVNVGTNGQLSSVSAENNAYFANLNVSGGSYTAETGFELSISENAVFTGVSISAASGAAVAASGADSGARIVFADCSLGATTALTVGENLSATISGGEYSGGIITQNGGDINIFGGTFKGDIAAQGDDAEINISGGSFDTDITEMVVYSSEVSNADGIYTVTDKSVRTHAGNHYKMQDILSQIPATLEASVYLAPTVNAAAGTIIGNYKTAGVSGTYNLEITAGGKPRIYLVTSSGAVISYTFNADIRTGGWAHIAVVTDADNDKLSLYINGELADSANVSGLELFAPSSALSIGIDERFTDLTKFFAGNIRSLSMFADVRSAEEISADMVSVSLEDTNLIANYSFVDGYDKNITDNSSNRCNLENNGWIKEVEPLEDYAYSFAVIGDTQIIAEYDPAGFNMIYDWIVANKDSHKIECVLGLGDITNSSTATEWELAMKNFAKLDGVVPYSVIRGNHDKDFDYNAYVTTDSFVAAQFNGYYNDLQTTYKLLKVGEVDYMILNLDYQPTDDEFAWAEGIIKSHPNHNVIITTHWNMNADKSVSNGIWENLASKYDNIIMVLSGHVAYPDVLVNKSVDENGNTVSQILIDPQYLDIDENVGSTGMIAMFYFSEDGKTVQVRNYSPIQDKYYAARNQFEMSVDTVEYRYGDVNNDSEINVIDLIRLKKLIAEMDVEHTERNTDCNFDGAIDSLDLVDLRKLLLAEK